ncbi:dTDP-4-amino-4,6-dideoxy-D-galactose acyltransferase [Yokenella regensburgei]|uniref:dTDP-4-amino-4,6-dideoxy-D-galactose acyltransferase n=1 Tax=Yokenella regensburgei TaxID=158877 RepID=UPI003F16BEB8
MAIHGTLEELAWESAFFGLRSAILRLQDDAPALALTSLDDWARVQVKIPAPHVHQLDALQQAGFKLVEGEADFALTVPVKGTDPQAHTAVDADIAPLRQMAANLFSQSRFRAPWYPPEASGRFYAQWIENAVKGVYDHECLLFRTANGEVSAFVSLRQLNDHEARIGLLGGYGAGEKLMLAACHWARQRQLTTLRVATQIGNLAAIKRYTRSGAIMESTAYWLYR